MIFKKFKTLSKNNINENNGKNKFIKVNKIENEMLSKFKE